MALHFPYLESAIAVLLGGAAWCLTPRAAHRKAPVSLAVSLIALLLTLGGWIDYATQPAEIARGPLANWLDADVLVIDSLNAPLLPLAALLYALTFAGTLRTKVRRFSFPGSLVAEALLLGAFTCGASWWLVGLLVARVVIPYIELRKRHRPTGVFVFHMVAFSVLLVAGYAFVDEQSTSMASGWALAPLVVAVLIYSGIAPFHCWAADLFEQAAFGTALLFMTPLVGAYAAARFVLPIASDAMLHGIGLIALFSAIYAAGMALVQREARRFFCYLLLSHSAIVLVGLHSASPIGVAGGLCVWLSVGLGLGGLGLTLRALEARHGRLSLDRYLGLYDHTPALAVCFLLTGLASVGFPCTFGFIGTEMLVDGAAHTYPYLVGAVVVIAAALNGIAVLQAYFLLFTGARHVSSVPLGVGRRERWAVLTLAAIIFGGGLFPRPGVASRYSAAQELLDGRHETADVHAKDAESDANPATSARSLARSPSR